MARRVPLLLSSERPLCGRGGHRRRGALRCGPGIEARAGFFDVADVVVGPAADGGREPATLDFFATVARAPFPSIVPFSYWRAGASDADDLATLVRLVAAGHLHPEIGLTADWRETPTVLVALAERRIRGNAVLTIG